MAVMQVDLKNRWVAFLEIARTLFFLWSLA